MIIWLKSVYQTFKISLTLFIVSSLKKDLDPDALVKERLAQRGFNWEEKKITNVLAIFSINNWEVELLNGLAFLGSVHHFQWKDVQDFFVTVEEWKSFRNEINERLIEYFDGFYDENVNTLVFIYASDFLICRETVAYLRRKNTIIVSFCWDDLLYFSGKVRGQFIGVKEISSESDINLTMSPEAIVQYNFYRNPCYFWESEEVESKLDLLEPVKGMDFYVLFIGSKYGRRGKFIDKLRKAGVTIKCFGDGWENERLNNDAMIHEIKIAPLVLGFSNVGYTKNMTTLKGRDFEVPLFGGLYLTQYSSGLRRYYLETEVLTYRSLKECIDRIDFLKENPTLAHQIRNAGYAKAQKLASWQSRFLFLDKLIYRLRS
jgi:spore maturation protein CgeB